MIHQGVAPDSDFASCRITSARRQVVTVVGAVDSVEQRVNYSHSAGSQWTAEVTLPATAGDDLLHVVRVNVSDEYNQLEYRIISNWLDFGKTTPGRASPASAVIQPAVYCICESYTLHFVSFRSKTSSTMDSKHNRKLENITKTLE